MNTLRWIQRCKKNFSIFVAACILSNIGFLLSNIRSNHLFFGIGIYCMLFWMFNPLPLFCAITGLRHYLTERKDSKNAATIGRQWLFLPVILFVSTVLYVFSATIMVMLTGGV